MRARFDFNLGLQFNWVVPMHGVDVGEVLNQYKATFKALLDLFERLVLDLYKPATAAFVTEFWTWLDCAKCCRLFRNDYADSRWAVPGKFNFKEGGA